MRGMRRPGLFLIDSFGYIFRAYHARARSGAPPMRTSKGLSTEAVFIFHNMVRKLLDAYRPEYIAAVFESEGPTLREQQYADYKANRPSMPPDLAEQIPYVRRLLDAMRIPVIEQSGYEADDVIGALARRAARSGVYPVIVSSDKDMLQLVDDQIVMLDPRKDDLWYDVEKTREFLGVDPAQVPDLLALKGDAVDNIPGAPGIGDKGARELITRYGAVEEALAHAGEIQRKSYRESLENHRDQILLSKRLATIAADAPVAFDLGDLVAREPDTAALREVYRELEFFSLLKDLDAPPAPEAPTPGSYRSLGDAEAVRRWLDSLAPEDVVAVAWQEGGAGELAQRRIGLAARPGEACAVSGDLLDELRPLFEDGGRRKAALDLKALWRRLADLGIQPRGFVDDPALYAFLVTADPASAAPEAVLERNLGPGAGAGVEALAAATLALVRELGEQVDRAGLRGLYESIDLPLVPVLARMERTGIRVDPAALANLSRRMEEELERLARSIHELAGHPFNINSPQQLGTVLFEELGLPAPPRSGKTKSLSTAADVLEGLAAVHPIAAQVLEYRQLAKLKGTYVDALPALISPETGRLHTTFNPAGAATGRLSSSNPNLQNIPIRTEIGREIRAAFLPRPGWRLLVADYSQIELRLLAHMSGDRLLVDAFRSGEDIHTRTAAEVFGTPPIAVTPELRRRAKAVNFGIIYGLSPFGLANQLGIPRSEAERYIASYFERHQGVRRFIDETIKEVRKTGETRTLFGRRRPIPDINSRNPNARGFAERTAVNTPLQGSAADLIKLAMIRIDSLLESQGLQAKLLLQVHDELVFEAPPEECEELAAAVRREMERAHPLMVPLVVDAGIGDNWRDAK